MRRLGVGATLATAALVASAQAMPLADRGSQIAIDVRFIEISATHSFGGLGISFDDFKDTKQDEKLGMGPGNGIGISAGMTFAPPATSILPPDAIASIEIGGAFLDFSKGQRGIADSRQDGSLVMLQITPRVSFAVAGGTQISLDLSPAVMQLTTDANAPGGDRHRSRFTGVGVTLGASVNIMLTPKTANDPGDLRPFLFFGARGGPFFGHLKESSTYGVGGGDGRTAWLYDIFGGVGLQVAPNIDVSLALDWLKITNAADATINNSGGSSGRYMEAITGTLRTTFKFK